MDTAAELMKAMARLRARLRTESAPTEMRWTWSQLTTLGGSSSRGRPSLLRNIPETRAAWLSVAIQALLDPAEQQLLLKTAAIMNRLADSEV